jgi:hypothetical protein
MLQCKHICLSIICVVVIWSELQHCTPLLQCPYSALHGAHQHGGELEHLLQVTVGSNGIGEHHLLHMLWLLAFAVPSQLLNAFDCTTEKSSAFSLPHHAQKNCTPLIALKNSTFCLAHCTQKMCTPSDALKNSTFCLAQCAQKICTPFAEFKSSAFNLALSAQKKWHAIGCTQKKRLLPCPPHTEKIVSHFFLSEKQCLLPCSVRRVKFTPFGAVKKDAFCPAKSGKFSKKNTPPFQLQLERFPSAVFLQFAMFGF